MNLAGFRARYPEFRAAPDTLVQSVLDESTESVDAALYRDKFDAAHGALTAHRLAISPFGKDARLVNDDGTTTYWGDFRRIRHEVAPRVIVT